MQITAEVNEISKNVKCNLTFLFVELSETADNFVKIRLVLEIKDIASFIKYVFIENEAASKYVYMWKCFILIRAAN